MPQILPPETEIFTCDSEKSEKIQMGIEYCIFL
jgi:hypothetical protein